MIQGQEFHPILKSIFGDVNGLNISPQVQVCCPRCQERDGLSHPDGKFNLEINTAKLLYRCWKCSDPPFAGSLGWLIKKYGSKADYEIYKAFASIYGEYSEEEKEYEYIRVNAPIETILFSDMDIQNLDHYEAYNYLINDRKLTRETILKYRLGFCVDGKYSRRIIIPSYDVYGEVNYFVARTYDPAVKKKKYDNPMSDKNSIIFNEGLIDWDSPVYLVEGVFDMFSVPNSIPLLGKTISNILYLKLKEYLPKIIIVLDPDAWNNEMNIYDTLRLLYDDESNMIRVVNLIGKYDIDETRKNLGHDAVVKLLYDARNLVDEDYFKRKITRGNCYVKNKTNVMHNKF